MKQELSHLTKRQIQILLLLYRFRYLNRPHIQTLLNHKHFKKIILWLNDLTEKKYITRFYTRTFAHTPAVYCLTTRSISYLKELENTEAGIHEKLLARIYKQTSLSKTFQTHCLFLADIYISLLHLTQQTQAKINFYTKTDLFGISYVLIPNPDAYFTITEKDETIQPYFLDIFDPLPPRMILKKRVQQYVNYFDAGYWQDNTNKSFPKILLVLPDEKSKRYIAKHIKELSDDSLSFYLSTWDAIRTHGLCKEVLEKVIGE